MKKFIALLLILVCAVSFVACSADTDVTSKNATENKDVVNELPKEAYAEYTKYLGTSYESFSEQFPGYEHGGWWIGSEWYNNSDEKISSVGVNGEYIGAIYIALKDAYPLLVTYADENGKVSKEVFEKYIEIETEYIWYPDEFSQPFLSYEENGMEFWAYCDTNGDIDVKNGSVTISLGDS